MNNGIFKLMKTKSYEIMLEGFLGEEINDQENSSLFRTFSRTRRCKALTG